MKKIQFKLTKTQLGAIAFLLVLLASVGGYFTWQGIKTNNQSVVRAYVCSDDLIKRSSLAINTNKIEDFPKLRSETLSLKGYDRDQNCLFIVARIDILTHSTEEAALIVQKLSKVYKPEGYSKSFTTPLFTVSQFESILAAVDSRKTEAEEQLKERREEARIQEEGINKMLKGEKP